MHMPLTACSKISQWHVSRY
ncbi:hypothetical protein E2C01_101003 [Portunus trituberculatus]|uniref:Uncharacterized protein n=1 Tax=Portunus trituberculatus TaxID=210409 RepID=A0A5B7KDM0_PORTR|nr:hypothetical protein [Portunus trituberculatus]